MATRERTKGQPFSVRFSKATGLFIEEEARRLKRSRSSVVEELADEAARTRLFPGLGFRDAPPHRRAWVIAAGLDVWEIVDILESYERKVEAVLRDYEVERRDIELALAYRDAFSEEVDALVAENRRSVEELKSLYPFVRYVGAE